MNKEVKELLNKCDNCKLKECIGCEFTYVDIQKIKKYVGNIEILNETYQVINELSEREIKKLEQKEAILDKVKEECKKQMTEYEDSILEIFPQKLLNIIEGEKKYIETNNRSSHISF